MINPFYTQLQLMIDLRGSGLVKISYRCNEFSSFVADVTIHILMMI
jgi:hypothetical protein